MSLQVWLPLDGTLNNNGLSNLIFTNLGASNTTVSTAGKIGSCYQNNAFTAGGMRSSATIDLGINQSMFCWVNFTTLNSSSSLGGSLVSQHRYVNNTGMGLTIKYVSSTTGYLSVNTGNGSSRTYNTYCATTLMNAGTWYHVGYTYDGAQIKLYVNGVCEKTQAYTGMSVPADYLVVFCWSMNAASGNAVQSTYNLNGKLNDVRIYDHCLTPSEVKEISQGLVLHYQFDGYEAGYGNPNLLTNSDFHSRYSQTTGWDTTKNGTLLANSWGGYNAGVSNPGTCYHAHLKLFENEYVYEYKKETETWLGISQSNLQTKLVAGNTYTFSCEQYSVTNTNYMTGGLYYYKTGASSGGFHLGQMSCNSNRQQGVWQKFTYTFVAPADGDYSKTMSWYCYGMSGSAGSFYLRHLKLEEGANATSWCLADSELAIDKTNVFDSSGYKHNGTMVNDISISNPSPRYANAIQFDTQNAYISTHTDLIFLNESPFTVALWVYCDDWSAQTATVSKGKILVNKYNTSTGGFRIYCGKQTIRYRMQWIDTDGTAQAIYFHNNSTLPSGWHHFVVTYDGTVMKTYRDGVHYSSKTTSFKNINTASCTIGAGEEYSLMGKYSDFRIYATALSASAVKELYNTSMSIDSAGNISARLLN